MIIDNFRAKLQQEAQIWRDEGIIDDLQYQQLAERYQFNNIETVARTSFVFILIGLGSILLGLGVITFVAANWQVWSREVKLTLLSSLFLVTNIIGFYLWRQPPLQASIGRKSRRRRQILGHSLLLLGALLIGANMALLAQIFQIGGSGYELFLAWGIGVLIMAYSLHLSSLGILALLLIQIGYWMGLGEFWYAISGLTWAQLVVQHMPLLSWVLFVPLAYLCQSSWIFALSAIAFATSWQFNLNPLYYLTHPHLAPWVVSSAFALPPALLWSYDDLLLPKINFRWFQVVARNLALIFFSILFYILSFRGWWLTVSEYQPVQNILQLKSIQIIDLTILSCVALWQWFNLLRPSHNPRQQKIDTTSVLIGCFIVIVASVPLWHNSSSGTDAIAIFIFNTLLAVLACGLIQAGLELTERRAFWGGMVLLILQIMSRMLEYNTDLVFKSLVFVFCGIAVIIAGLWFEHRLNVLRS